MMKIDYIMGVMKLYVRCVMLNKHRRSDEYHNSKKPIAMDWNRCLVFIFLW